PLPSLAAAAALLFAGAALYGGLDLVFDLHTPSARAAIKVSPSRASEFERPASPVPVIYVGAFQAEGGSGAASALANQIPGELRGALARSDELKIISGAAPTEATGTGAQGDQPSRYELSASVETDGSGAISVALRLADVADRRIAFARTFQQS